MSLISPNPAIEAVEAEIASMLSDPSVRTMAKRHMRDALECDPVDAADDATFVARLLIRRLRAILGEASSDLVPF